MKLLRPASSFESSDEWNDYWADSQHAAAFARIDAAFARANPEGIRPGPPVDDGFEPAVFDFADVRREREDG